MAGQKEHIDLKLIRYDGTCERMVHNQPLADSIKVLAFDVFGTVVDQRSSVIAEGERLGKSNHLSVDWAAFADAWRGVYRPNLNRVLSGELPWTKLDDLHRISLAEMLKQFKIEGLSEDEIVDFKPYLAPAKALARFGSGSAAAEIALRGYDAF